MLKISAPRAVLKKKCFENMQQTYDRTPMLTYDFNKAPKQATLLKSHLGMGVLP